MSEWEEGFLSRPLSAQVCESIPAAPQQVLCLSCFTFPIGPSGGTQPPVGPASGADSREEHLAAAGPEASAVLTGVC